MFTGESVKTIVKKTYEARGFAKKSLFHYKSFYQLELEDEYSTSFNTADSYYFFYITKGALFVTVDKEVHTLSRNDLLIVEKDTFIKMSSSQCALYITEFDGKLAPDYMEEIIESRKSVRSIMDFSNIVMFFVRLKELSAYETLNEVYVSLNLEAILVEVYARKYYGTEIENPHSYAIIQALFYVEQNIDKKITLEDLAEFVGYSVYHFSRLFKREVGLPPYEYIIRFRLDLAKHFLITTQKNVKDIAKECGYQNEINFYNIFKKNVGMSPKQFRMKNVREEAN